MWIFGLLSGQSHRLFLWNVGQLLLTLPGDRPAWFPADGLDLWPMEARAEHCPLMCGLQMPAGFSADPLVEARQSQIM